MTYPESEGTYAALCESLQRQRDEARAELDELRQAAPNADVAYWQDRCLDHATVLDRVRIERDELKKDRADVERYASKRGERAEILALALEEASIALDEAGCQVAASRAHQEYERAMKIV